MTSARAELEHVENLRRTTSLLILTGEIASSDVLGAVCTHYLRVFESFFFADSRAFE